MRTILPIKFALLIIHTNNNSTDVGPLTSCRSVYLIYLHKLQQLFKDHPGNAANS